MFTGLIQTTGKLLARRVHGGSGSLEVAPECPITSPEVGESIAVNGTCLTLESGENHALVFHVLEETLTRTNLGSIPVNATVNLERSLQLGDRLGGHLVSGHVDATAKVLALTPVAGDTELTIELPGELAPYLIEKGSIAIDGISLTLVRVQETCFTVHLIPVTMRGTNLHQKKTGDLVNLETDMIGKYVAKQLQAITGDTKRQVTMDLLRRAGW